MITGPLLPQQYQQSARRDQSVGAHCRVAVCEALGSVYSNGSGPAHHGSGKFAIMARFTACLGVSVLFAVGVIAAQDRDRDDRDRTREDRYGDNLFPLSAANSSRSNSSSQPALSASWLSARI